MSLVEASKDARGNKSRDRTRQHVASIKEGKSDRHFLARIEHADNVDGARIELGCQHGLEDYSRLTGASVRPRKKRRASMLL